jgi:hypothetical protein
LLRYKGIVRIDRQLSEKAFRAEADMKFLEYTEGAASLPVSMHLYMNQPHMD